MFRNCESRFHCTRSEIASIVFEHEIDFGSQLKNLVVLSRSVDLSSIKYRRIWGKSTTLLEFSNTVYFVNTYSQLYVKNKDCIQIFTFDWTTHKLICLFKYLAKNQNETKTKQIEHDLKRYIFFNFILTLYIPLDQCSHKSLHLFYRNSLKCCAEKGSQQLNTYSYTWMCIFPWSLLWTFDSHSWRFKSFSRDRPKRALSRRSRRIPKVSLQLLWILYTAK